MTYSRFLGNRDLKEVVINKLASVETKSDYHHLILLAYLQGFPATWIRNRDPAATSAQTSALQGRGVGRVLACSEQAVHPVRRRPERNRGRDGQRDGQEQGHLQQAYQPDRLLA